MSGYRRGQGGITLCGQVLNTSSTDMTAVVVPTVSKRDSDVKANPQAN